MTASKSLVTQNGVTRQIPDADSLLVGTGIDRSTAGDLVVGGTTATSITLGSATTPVNIPGDVTTVGGTTFTTDATFEGNVTFGNGPSDTVTFAETTTVINDIAFNGAGYRVTNMLDPTGPSVQEGATAAWVTTQIAAIPPTTPGAPADSIQFNDSAGGFAGSANLTWSGTSLDVTGAVNIAGGDPRALTIKDITDATDILFFDASVEALTVQSSISTSVTTIDAAQMNISDAGHTAQLSASAGSSVKLDLFVPVASSVVPSIVAADSTAAPVSLKLDASQIDVNSVKIVNVADGVDSTDAVNKSQLAAATLWSEAAGVITVADPTSQVKLGGDVTSPDEPLLIADTTSQIIAAVTPTTSTLKLYEAGAYETPGSGSTVLITAQAAAPNIVVHEVGGGETGIYPGTLTLTGYSGLGGFIAVADNGGTLGAGALEFQTGEIRFGGSAGSAGQVLTSNGTGSAPTWTTPTVGAVTDVTATAPLLSSGGATPDISLTGVIDVANGGTGVATITAGSLVVGDGTNAVNEIAPGSNGEVLTVVAGAWSSQALPATTDYSVVDITTAVPQGDAVTVAGAAAVATSTSSARVAGMVSATANKVSVLGIIADCNFEGSLTLAVGEAVYLSASSAGKLTNVPPSGSGEVVAELGIIAAVNTAGGGAAAASVLWQPKSIVII